MKRYIICLISFFVFLFACGFDREQKKVYDNANLLSEEEEDSLNQLCMKAAQKSKADFVVVIVESLDGKTATKYADDFYDDNGFGYNKEMGDGTLFLIAMEEQKCAFTTSVDCALLFSQCISDKIIEEASSYLTDGQYYKGFESYIESTQDYISRKQILDLLIEFIAALGVASITIWIMYSTSKSKISVNGFTYASGHKSNVTQQHDVFQRTTTIKRHINNTPKEQRGTHIGSSGNRHGGSSGGF